MAYCDKHRRQHLDAGCSKCWEEDAAKAKAGAAANVEPIRPCVRPPVRPVDAAVKPAKADAQRYRDPEKRRAYLRTYMREFMRKRRASS